MLLVLRSVECQDRPPKGIVVVKIGGSTLGSNDTTLKDLVALQRDGVKLIVVHGGGSVISQWMERNKAPSPGSSGV